MEQNARLSNELQKLTLKNALEKDKLIIGLDFGTTFSGVAYAFTTNPEQVFCIDTWPGANGRKVPKAPTVIKYDDDSKTSLKWGYEVNAVTEGKIERFKLLLDPDQERPLYIADNTKAELANLGKDVVDVASDYIRAIYQHALRQIEQSFLADYIRSYEKEYVLSVPAVWSDKAKDSTQRAARKAGIGPITLIKEPEAAALYTLHYNRKKGLQVGDATVVCDAGGGTVDLISYEIMNLSPLEVNELAPCSGGLSGSVMLNERFEQWLQNLVGDTAFVSLKATDGFQLAMQSFDTLIKPEFRGKDDSDKFVSFPMAKLKDSQSKGIHRNSIVVSGDTLFKIFDPLRGDIDKLVKEQVDKVRIKRLREKHPQGDAVKAIFLVGGFGSSMYLKHAIEASHPDIQVLQPPDAWSAIVKGAVMSKLPQEASVKSNIAEKHYGTSCNSIYDRSRDRGRPHFPNDWDGTERCETMSWFIYKDDTLVRANKVSLEFDRKFAGKTPQAEDLKIVDELYESTALVAPTHPTDVKLNCTLHTDLTKVPKHHFIRKTRKSDGEHYTELCYSLLVEIQSGPMKFSLEVDGKEYSAVDADY